MFRFAGTHSGDYTIASQTTIKGIPLPRTNYLTVLDLRSQQPLEVNDYSWTLDGVRSNLRYTSKQEKTDLESVPKKQFLGKYISCMIPIKKNEAWWNLAQDERREIMEEKARHFSIGRNYLTEIDRVLYHSRDLEQEFDFVTWFNFYPEHENMFNELVLALRESLEWQYVTREIDIRMFIK